MQEAPIPAGPDALQERVRELQVRRQAAPWREEGLQPEQAFQGRWGVETAVSPPPPAPAEGAAGAAGLRAGAAPRAEGR